MIDYFAAPAEPRTPMLSQEGPWVPRDLLRAVRLSGVGVVGLAAAWFYAATNADWTKDAKWIVLAAVSLTLASLGSVGWLLAGVQRVSRERQAVTILLRARLDKTNAEEHAAGEEVSVEGFVTAEGMDLYHRRSCLLMKGKAPIALGPVGHPDSGVTACGVCRP